MTNVPTVDNPSDSTRTRFVSDSDLDKISTKPGYCPSIRELSGKSTAAAETRMDSATATKPNQIFLLKEAVQLLKHEKSAWTEVTDLRKKLKDLLDPGYLMTEVKSQINSQLETFRTEVKASIQTQVKCALQIQTKTFADSLKSNVLDSNLTHASSGNPTKSENLTQTSSQVSIDGIEETPPGSNISDTNHLDSKIREVFNHLGIETNISFIERIGKPRRVSISEQPSPRTALVTVSTSWDAKRILDCAHLLKNFKSRVYISAALTKQEKEIENELLKKRRELINNGEKIDSIRIRNLKLFVKDTEIKLQAPTEKIQEVKSADS